MNPSPHGLELISKLLDKTISEDEFSILHRLLEDDPGFRQLYMQTIDQEVEFSCHHSEFKTPRIPVGRRTLLLAIAALLIVSLFSIVVTKSIRKTEQPEVVKVPPQPDGQHDPVGNLRPVPLAPDLWEQSFEDGLPNGWEAEFVSTGLPPGSRGAIRTISKTEAGRNYRNITPPMAWAPGYIKVGSNTHLHITFRVDNAADFDFFMLTHVPDPKRNDISLYKRNGSRINAKPGTWRKVSIPLAEFQRKDAATETFVDGGPDNGEVVWQLFVSALNPYFDLVIDHWRVDQEGPGVLTVSDIEQ